MYPNLKLQIWKSGIRQNRLAQILRIDETKLSRIVNGFRKPSDELQARIATLLNSDPAWLFQESDSLAQYTLDTTQIITKQIITKQIITKQMITK